MRWSSRSRRIAGVGGLVTVLAVAGAVTVAASTDDEGAERPITGRALDRASQAALAHTGEGRVTGTEAGDEDAYYEVEVTLDDGSQVDVALDRGFRVVGTEADDESDTEPEG